jgi:hypothetical protein
VAAPSAAAATTCRELLRSASSSSHGWLHVHGPAGLWCSMYIIFFANKQNRMWLLVKIKYLGVGIGHAPLTLLLQCEYAIKLSQLVKQRILIPKEEAASSRWRRLVAEADGHCKHQSIHVHTLHAREYWSMISMAIWGWASGETGEVAHWNGDPIVWLLRCAAKGWRPAHDLLVTDTELPDGARGHAVSLNSSRETCTPASRLAVRVVRTYPAANSNSLATTTVKLAVVQQTVRFRNYLHLCQLARR